MNNQCHPRPDKRQRGSGANGARGLMPRTRDRKETAMKRTLARIAIATGLVAGLTVAAAAAAQAAESDCPSGNVCIWIDGGYAGAPTAYGAPTFRNLNPSDHDKVSSWKNRTSLTYCLYDNGSSVILDVLGPGARRNPMRSGTNDRADAIGRC